MAFIERSFKKINKEFRYGVIYVITSFNRVWDSDMSINHRLPSRLLEWLRRLTGFDVEIVEDPGVSETKLVARRINVGNAGKEAVVEMPLHYSSFSDVMRFAQSATDVLSTDEGDQMLEQEGYLDSDDWNLILMIIKKMSLKSMNLFRKIFQNKIHGKKEDGLRLFHTRRNHWLVLKLSLRRRKNYLPLRNKRKML